ncbi:MAG TPA: site-specific integrase [Savagea sp.]
MMYCRKLKNGKWSCTADASPDPATGKRRQVTLRGDTKREAQQKVLKMIKDLNDHLYFEEVKQMNFKQLSSLWFEHYQQTGVRPNTIRIRQDALAIIERHIGHIPLLKLRYQHFQNFIYTIQEDYSYNTLSGIKTTMNLVMQHAQRNLWIKQNPVPLVLIPKKKERQKINQYFDTEQLNEFLQTVNESGLRLDKEWFYLLAFTGLRSGELCGLMHDDFDEENGTLYVQRTLTNKTGNLKKYTLGPTKTEKSKRLIYLDTKIVHLIKQLIINNKKMKLLAGKEFHSKRFIFCRHDGYPYTPAFINGRLQRILKLCPHLPRITPHALRHTHISLLAEARVPLATIMERVGHTDIETTMRIYTHATERSKKEAAQQLSLIHSDLLDQLL